MIGMPSLHDLDEESTATRIWLCTHPIDMRLGFNRLIAPSVAWPRRVIEPTEEPRLKAQNHSPGVDLWRYARRLPRAQSDTD